MSEKAYVERLEYALAQARENLTQLSVELLRAEQKIRELEKGRGIRCCACVCGLCL